MKKITVASVLILFIAAAAHAQKWPPQSDKPKQKAALYVIVKTKTDDGVSENGPYKIKQKSDVQYMGDFLVVKCADESEKIFSLNDVSEVKYFQHNFGPSFSPRRSKPGIKQ